MQFSRCDRADLLNYSIPEFDRLHFHTCQKAKSLTGQGKARLRGSIIIRKSLKPAYSGQLERKMGAQPKNTYIAAQPTNSSCTDFNDFESDRGDRSQNWGYSIVLTPRLMRMLSTSPAFGMVWSGLHCLTSAKPRACSSRIVRITSSGEPIKIIRRRFWSSAPGSSAANFSDKYSGILNCSKFQSWDL